MQALVKFLGGMLRLPLVVQVWLGVLMAANMIVPLFYFGRTEAQVVFVSFMANLLLMLLITSASGFTRLLGLGHSFWVLLVPFLVARLGSVPAEDVYGVWLRCVIVLNLASLSLDVWDVIRFARGDRAEVVSFD